jgi:hypothetical protein
MSPAERYRALAAEFQAKAHLEESAERAADFEHLAQCYGRLAEQAARNALTDVTYEPPLGRLDDGEPPID